MKKGFTLIELLAVIAVLGILVVLAITNVTSFFTSSKEKSFVIQAQTIYKKAYDDYVTNKLSFNIENINTFCNIDNGKVLNITVASNVKYVVKFTDDKISSFKITDGTFSYVNDSITSVDDISIKDTHFKKKNIDAVNSCD